MSLAPGARLGSYEITSPIGAGGMGVVYKARDTRLGRTVAIKVLPEDAAADPVARRRLIREARAAASLDHPFICKVYEVGEHDGAPFIAMEFLEGRTLERRLGEGPLAPREALRLALEMAEALQHAHAHGLIHRDLKPANVMLATDDHVKVMDFGIARHVPAAGATTAETQSALVTAPGTTVGTVAYMSPEQLMAQPLDARSDIFAFGIVLYEMLAGAHPFRKNSAVSTANAILTEGPPPFPPARPALPENVDRALQRMLAKDREARYPDMASVRADLRWALEPPRAAAAAPAKPRWRRGWMAAVPVAVAAVLIVLVAWAIAMFLPGREPALAFRARDWVVVADFENQTGDKVFDRSLDRALAVGIQQSRYVNVLPRSQVEGALRRMARTDVKALDEAAAAEVAVREGARAVLACSIAQVGETYVLTARLIEPASRSAVLTESANAANKNGVLAALDQLLTGVRRNLGESLTAIDRQKTGLPRATTNSLEALSAYARGMELRNDRTGLKLLEQAVALDGDFALAHAELGVRYYQSDQREREIGEEHFRKALGLLDRLTVRERLWIEALAEDSRGRREQAVTAYRAYLSQYPDDALAWFRLGWTLMAPLDRPADAIPAFQRALELDRSSAGAYINLATCYQGLGKYAEALSDYQKAFDLNPDALTAGFVNHEYGFTLVRLGRAEEARPVFDKMIAQQDPSRQAAGLRSLALLEMFHGRYAAASALLARAVVLNQATRGPLSEYRNRMYLVTNYRMLGRAGDAATQAAAAGRLASANRFDPGFLLTLGTFESLDGHLREARDLLARASETAKETVAASGVNRSSTADQSNINLLRGEIALAEGRAAEALDLFDTSLRMWPTQTMIAERAARALVELGRYGEARQKYEAIVEAREFGFEAQELWFAAHVELGKIHEREGNTVRAREYYEKLIALWKDGDPTLRLLVEARARLKKLPS
jgi:eukaryotic-like serine/threonine-protein kinase